jgi:tetratricopeptide (TPR) repeat protein
MVAWLQDGGTPPVPPAPILVVVLPFESPDGSEEDEFMALGLTEVVAAQLSRLRAVAVPIVHPASAWRGPRGSWAEMAEQYAGKPWAQVARELGADAVVRGRIQRSGGNLRLELQLFDAAERHPPWSRTLHFGGTELAHLQREASKAIAAALNVAVSPSERAVLEHLPTTNPEAYQLYLQGRALEVREAFRHGIPASAESWQGAHSLYVRARELDPTFALARARASFTALAITVYGSDRTRARLDQARLEAEAALRLHPGLPEAHEALAYYWSFNEEYLKAAEEMKHAIAGLPNFGDLHVGLAMFLRELGRWEEAVHAHEVGIEFDPRHRGAHFEAALTFYRMRRYPESIRKWDRVIELDPSDPFPHLVRGYTYQRLEGTVDSLEAALTRIPSGWDDGGIATWARFTALRNQRRFADAVAMLDSSTHSICRDWFVFRPLSLMRASLLDELGQHALAQTSYEEARRLLEDSVAAHPRNSGMRVALGLAYAGLGRRTDAIREAKTVAELLPPWDGHSAATAALGGAVEVYTRIGETDAALQLLEVLLAVPAGREVSIPLLLNEPLYDPLRSDPRFDRMVERFSTF